MPGAAFFEHRGAVPVPSREKLWKTSSACGCFIEDNRLGFDVRERFTDVLALHRTSRALMPRPRALSRRSPRECRGQRARARRPRALLRRPHHVADAKLPHTTFLPRIAAPFVPCTDSARCGIARSTHQTCRPGIDTSSAQNVIHIPDPALDATGVYIVNLQSTRSHPWLRSPRARL